MAPVLHQVQKQARKGLPASTVATPMPVLPEGMDVAEQANGNSVLSLRGSPIAVLFSKDRAIEYAQSLMRMGVRC
jgi:hypothetical protein